MKRALTLFITALILGACGANQPIESSNTSSNTSSAANTAPSNPVKTVTIANIIPYKKGAPIAQNIQLECTLNSQLSEFIQSYGNEQNIAVTRAASVNPNSKGNVLLVNIVNAVSQGNAFLGHRKFTQVEGTLYENGKKVAAFTGARFSGGGFFGAYKGSCSVLGRTVQTLGKDIAQWLVHPVDGMHMGDGI
ncbi:MAG: hypothetical protein R6X06_12455 [Gammaproteobacteria bacterium]